MKPLLIEGLFNGGILMDGIFVHIAINLFIIYILYALSISRFKYKRSSLLYAVLFQVTIVGTNLFFQITDGGLIRWILILVCLYIVSIKLAYLNDELIANRENQGKREAEAKAEAEDIATYVYLARCEDNIGLEDGFERDKLYIVISETDYTMKVFNMFGKETKVYKCKFSSILKEKRENLTT